MLLVYLMLYRIWNYIWWYRIIYMIYTDYWNWSYSWIISKLFFNILLFLSLCASLTAFIYYKNNLYAWMCIALRDKLLKDTIRWFVKWQTVMSWLNRIIIFEADLMLRFIHTLFSQCFYHEFISLLNIS